MDLYTGYSRLDFALIMQKDILSYKRPLSTHSVINEIALYLSQIGRIVS